MKAISLLLAGSKATLLSLLKWSWETKLDLSRKLDQRFERVGQQVMVEVVLGMTS
jgi:hypothetical protein